VRAALKRRTHVGGIRGCSPRSSQKSSHSLGKSTISKTYIFFQSAFQSAFPEARTRSVRIFLESGKQRILLTYSLSMPLGMNSYFRGSHRMVFLFRLGFGPPQHIVQRVDNGPQLANCDARVLGLVLV
jgi:hypothetical protein